MAEVIGIVSGAIAFATVAAQVTKSIIKINECWGQLRDAPEGIRQIARELEVFRLIIVGIEEELSQESVALVLKNSQHTIQSFELCKEAAKELETVADELTQDTRSPGRLKRSYASLRVVMQKGRLDKYTARLRNSIQLLSLSQQCYMRALLQAQPTLIAQRLAASNELAVSEESGTLQSNEATLKARGTGELSLHAEIPVRSSWPQGRKNRDKPIYTWKLSLPTWITFRRIEIAGTRLPSGWHWVFRTPNIVHWNSPAMNCIRAGNVKGLQQLLSSGEISPFDQSEGESPLTWWTIAMNRVEVLKLLVDQGADVAESMSAISFSQFISGKLRRGNEVYLPLMRVMVDNLGDMIEDTPEEAAEGILSSIIGTPEEFLFLQRHVCPSFYQMPHWVRVAVATRALDKTSHRPPRSDTIRTILGDDPLSPQDLQTEWPRIWMSDLVSIPRLTLVQAMVATMGGLIAIKNRPPPYFDDRDNEVTATRYESWRRLFRETLEAGIHVHQIVAGWTPLLTLLGSQISEQWTWTYPSSRCKNDWDRALREWLANLKAACIDLNEFGRREEAILKSGMVERDFKWRRSRDHFIRLIGFRYGPCPDDWSLWWSEWSDEFVGDFWAMIERRFEMPGSWPMETNIIL